MQSLGKRAPYQDDNYQIQKKQEPRYDKQSHSYHQQNSTSHHHHKKEEVAGCKVVLDIEKMKSTILEQIRANQVVVISGETGCGKSTQVPQYILAEALQLGKRCKILCTQPRRIACISIAKRVAAEMDEELGRSVGYHISMDANIRLDSKIIFVTNGILLNYLTHNPSMLVEYTHIIIDEVHERDIDSDFILILFKLFLSHFPELKLILMSATINAELFARYFSKEGIERAGTMTEDDIHYPDKLKTKKADIKAEKQEGLRSWDNVDYSEHEVKDTWNTNSAAKKDKKEESKADEQKLNRIQDAHPNDTMATILEIDSKRKYKIRDYFLNELKEFYTFKSNYLNKFNEFNFNKKRAVLINEVVFVAIELIEFLHNNEKYIQFPNKKIDMGGILVFLPGLNEITYFIQMINERISRTSLEQLEFIPLHSTIAQMYEEDVFSQKPGKRKVIVCTNIAESSLTIPDIIFVIDFCLSKEFKFDPKCQSQRLDLVWACRASCKQRTGRTGRVCDGMSFRMVSHDFYNKVLDPFTEAEMLRSPLDKVILKISVLHEEIEKKNDLINKSVVDSQRNQNVKINEVFLAIAKRVFSSPVVVLNVAIENPSWDQIIYAMNFLTTSGAFIITDQEKYKGKITFLGRVYSELPCNLTVCKLLLFGHLFGCFDDMVTIGVMMMHPKSIWLPRTGKSHDIDPIDFYKRIDRFADGEFSDHILYLNMYKDWFENYGTQSDYNKRGRRGRYNDRNSVPPNGMNENDWARKHNVRFAFMAEILANRYDLKKRMHKFLPLSDRAEHQTFNGMSDEKKRERYLMIKVCVAASSIPYYAVGKFLPNSKQKNEIDNMQNELKLDPVYCANLYDIHLYKVLNTYTKTVLDEDDVKINEKYQTIRDDDKINIWRVELSSHIEKNYGRMDKMIINPRVAYVQFRKETADLSIRLLLFEKNYKRGLTSTLSVYSVEGQGMTSIALEAVPEYMKAKNRNEGKKEHNELLASLRQDVISSIKNITDVAYSYTPQYENLFSRASLVVESLSIASVVTRARPEALRFPPTKDVCLIYSEEIQANNKNFLAKMSSIMPDIPLFIEYMLLIFANTVYLECDQKYDRITHIKIGASDLKINYWISRAAVMMINKMRADIKLYLENKDGDKKTLPYLWEDLLNLLNEGTKEPFYPVDEWYDYFVANIYKVPECLKDGDQTEVLTSLPDIRQENTYDEGFMNLLRVSCDLSKTKNQMAIMKEFIKWKRNFVKDIDNIQYKLNCSKSFLVCPDKDCRREIVEIAALRGHLEHDCFRAIESHARPSVKTEVNLGYFGQAVLDKVKVLTEFGYKVEALFTCYTGHFIGFKIQGFENNVCIHRDSLMVVRFQDLSSHEYKNYELDTHQLAKDDRLSEIKKTGDIEFFTCVACDPNRRFKSNKDLAYHLFEDKGHKYKMTLFTENL